jgi:glycerophosphoryl diester phosphodiesterase
MSERPFSQAVPRLIVAHRGAPLEAPENTLASLDRAVQVGAPAIEFDVRLTADGHAVVMHDPSIDRTTDGLGLVRSLTLEQIRRVHIAGGDGRAHDIPTLGEALSLLSGRAAVDIEIKNLPGEPDFDPDSGPVVRAVHAALEEVGFVGPVIVASFNPVAIATSRELRPDIPTGLLTPHAVDAEAALTYAAAEGHDWVLPFVGRVGEAGDAFPRAVHEAGLLLGTWLTDDPNEAVALFRAGVDAVATNDPRAVVEACAEAFGR